MRKIRGFQLVVCADTWDGGGYTVVVLKRAVTAKVKRGLTILFPNLWKFTAHEGLVIEGWSLMFLSISPGSCYKSDSPTVLTLDEWRLGLQESCLRHVLLCSCIMYRPA